MFFIWIVLFGLTNVLCEDFYSFTVKDSEGNDVQLEQYRGKVNSSFRLKNKYFFDFILGFIGCECRFFSQGELLIKNKICFFHENR